MSYRASVATIEANESLLESLRSLLETESKLVIDFESPEDMQRDYVRIRGIIKRADSRHVLGGRFLGLSKAVAGKLDYDQLTLTFLPRAALPHVKAVEHRSLNAKPSEKTAFRTLQRSSASMEMLEFVPSSSFNAEEFEEAALSIGWRVARVEMELPDGALLYGAQRLAEGQHAG